MPIRHTDQGWFWGSKGPFETKTKAESIQRATYASGYKKAFDLWKQFSPSSRGLVPQSGDPQHPGRWVRPDRKEASKRFHSALPRLLRMAQTEEHKQALLDAAKKYEGDARLDA